MIHTVAQRAREVMSSIAPRGEQVLSVLVLGDSIGTDTAHSFSQQTAASSAFEVLAGNIDEALRDAKGTMLAVMVPGVVVDPTFVEAMLARANRNAVVVPVGAVGAPETRAGRLELALGTSGSIFPIRLARRAGKSMAGALGTDILFRAEALSNEKIAIECVAVPPPVQPPCESELTPSDACASWLATFRRLTSVAQANGPLRAPIRKVIRGLSNQIGRQIARDPALRTVILHELDDHPIPGFSLRLMNAECAQDLVISYAFPPYLDTSGFVMSRRFAGRTNAYDVVTQNMSSHRAIDERSLTLVQRDVGKRMLIGGRAALGSWSDVERFCTRGMAKIDEREAKLGEYKTLYSRSMWAASSVLAAWYKVKHPQIPWTAELSDPLVVRPNGETRENPMPPNEILADIDAAVRAKGLPGWSGDHFFEAVEWMVYALADEIVYTNENQREFMLSAWPDRTLADRAREKSVVSHHPVPAPELYMLGNPDVEIPHGKTTIAYFGNFYDVRGVADILDPFAQLTASERDLLSLLIFTKDSDEIRAKASSHPAGDCVAVHAALPYFDFLNLTTQVDWLVLADAHRPASFTNNPYLPSKLADYRGSGSKIWGLVDEGSTLSREPLDARTPLGDVDAGTRAIRTQILKSR